MIEFTCTYCHKKYTRSKSFSHKTLRICNNNYCSQKCNGLHRRELNTQKTKCSNCDKEFIRINSQIKSKNLFCSQSCAAKYNNTHKTKGNRRSKLEKYLEEQLTNLYPNLEIHFNRKDTINSELDIYIPSLKLAFELNGIFHYEPIYGQDKMTQIKNNDNRKFQACIEHAIELCIIDTSSQKYFKESTSKKFLDIIINIINRKEHESNV